MFIEKVEIAQRQFPQWNIDLLTPDFISDTHSDFQLQEMYDNKILW
jgi:hypothetical protein